ncbi:competence protein ComEA [Clostridium acetobutylicum]|uniref:Competence ComEA protein n=1 Tax=Clostridium acetobutylicum (strain ATCC 824 / DSM 792 / JCM 1419 / IAM 19013 / LMG 5710 / NBRC 13948 / NRRL B-527 / VKM B-1787 / 2291 / W) TaxID=272562 RepID=Q97JK6_CLOAB|nr:MULTISPECIES: ComEA family DNA-binding protein [Clostridium]AAK79239.1 Competence ComEA protein [Clostridium acetobutylicum ATCC 824]ADZ20319.1 Competence ComEA protein [Clostridium acetobutylicum EA 2018]AEI33298.1 competence ComEA protein [Clostridium acetobutylicum DSM 1731]AWV81511.1 ComEA family DNA-binding protein [Clostridium acetobutylicum]MBC2393150.1 ComEA family DNA-binding protein [Clostridium acetobutylicum]
MKNKKAVVGSITIIFIFVVLIFIGYEVESRGEDNSSNVSVSEVMNNKKSKKSNENETKEVSAQIFGAVKNPGVYSLKSNSRVKDLIDQAGGFLDNADKFSINGAAKLVDGANIYVKAQGEKDSKVTNTSSSQENTQPQQNSSGEDKLDINTATVDDIVSKKIKGIGKGLAQRIVDYREKNGGRISSVEDLQKAIGKKRGQDLMDYVNIN